MELTYYGQSCFLLQAANRNILFDPFITPNELASHVDINAIEADYILVSHGHQDHTADLVALAKRTGALVICSFEIMLWLAKQGVENVHAMNLGGQYSFDFGKVKMVYAAHSNSLPDGTYGGTAAGFVLQCEGKTLYYAGDTALIQEMKLIGELARPDVCLLPIGDNFTMGVEDAVIAAGYLRCKHIIGMHYDTFPPIKIDKDRARGLFKKAGCELSLIDIGSSLTV